MELSLVAHLPALAEVKQSPSEGNDMARSLDKGFRYPENSDMSGLFLT